MDRASLLPLAWSPLRDCAERRSDPEWLRQRWLDPGSRVVLMRADQVGVDGTGAVAWGPPVAAPDEGQPWAFLGCDSDDAAHFVLGIGAEAAAARPDLSWRSLREVADAAGASAAVAAGVALLNWHHRHPRCPRCGGPTRADHGGWQRTCDADGSSHFPRVDPAVIMLVRDPADRALLGRQRRWPPGWFSTLAGFVEPGETLERAVVREVAEEVGLRVTRADYLASQPWPFPNSIMLGFHAYSAGDEPTPDGEEIVEARWVSRADLQQACASGEIRLPPALSVSRWLIEHWYGAELPGGWSR